MLGRKRAGHQYCLYTLCGGFCVKQKSVPGRYEMKKMVFAAALLTLIVFVPLQTRAGIDVSIHISLPPPIAFTVPPEVVILPDTDYVYAVPDLDLDLFFWNGWWWRFWEGRWYRSSYYDWGWEYYAYVPIFFYDIDPDWRIYYRDRHWYGHVWHYERIPYERLRQNWHRWYNDRYWDREHAWGVENYRPRPERDRQIPGQQREWRYRQRPEVRQSPSRPEARQFDQRPGTPRIPGPEARRFQDRPEVRQFQQNPGNRRFREGAEVPNLQSPRESRRSRQPSEAGQHPMPQTSRQRSGVRMEGEQAPETRQFERKPEAGNFRRTPDPGQLQRRNETGQLQQRRELPGQQLRQHQERNRMSER